MKINLYILFFFSFISRIFATVPVWNLDGQSINLLSGSSSFQYILYENNGVKLIKTIRKNDNNISYENQLIINNTIKIVDFEDIESYYFNELGC